MHEEKKEKIERSAGEMQKRREQMADGKRYIIYYTFENRSKESRSSTGAGEDKKYV
jgi:hypothetical protein